jgi:hypothetical protein
MPRFAIVILEEIVAHLGVRNVEGERALSDEGLSRSDSYRTQFRASRRPVLGPSSRSGGSLLSIEKMRFRSSGLGSRGRGLLRVFPRSRPEGTRPRSPEGGGRGLWPALRRVGGFECAQVVHLADVHTALT